MIAVSIVSSTERRPRLGLRPPAVRREALISTERFVELASELSESEIRTILAGWWRRGDRQLGQRAA